MHAYITDSINLKDTLNGLGNVRVLTWLECIKPQKGMLQCMIFYPTQTSHEGRMLMPGYASQTDICPLCKYNTCPNYYICECVCA